MSWDEFVQTYLNDTDSGEDNAEIDEEQRDWLERLSQQPWQLNRIERNDLLRLPFLDEEQADSILSYRQKRHGFLSLGELQLIKGIDYYTRCYLSLFVRCDSAALPDEAYLNQRQETDKLKQKFRQGHHELETRLDVPLYKREGYKVPDKPTKTNYYYGNALHHVIRYAYNCKREVMYGLTMEKDAGEPIVKKGFYPYDYLSGYFLLRPKQKAWGLVFGDYNVFSGCGLLFGRPFYGGREQLARNMRRTSTLFKAHTSASESNYFRGAAVAYRWKSIDVLTFLSYRRLDANYDGGDSVRTILKTGLHRTISEIDNRRNLGCLTFGAHAGYEKQRWSLALDGYMAHYDHTVCPKERYYNKYYFRGRTTGALSATYNVFLSKFKTQGELASDNKGHISTIHTLGYQFSKKIGINAQWRFFTPAFVSVYGSAMQQGSHVANEQGCLLLVRYLPIKW